MNAPDQERLGNDGQRRTGFHLYRRAGTGWLYDQLKHHPDFWLPPVKELDYLNHSKPSPANVRKNYELGKADPDRMRERIRRASPKEYGARFSNLWMPICLPATIARVGRRHSRCRTRFGTSSVTGWLTKFAPASHCSAERRRVGRDYMGCERAIAVGVIPLKYVPHFAGRGAGTIKKWPGLETAPRGMLRENT
jgi:hypothetical protein